MKLIFLGAPGAGKGTQAAIVSKKLEIPAISTGDILRTAVKEGTPTGQKAKAFMDAGKLVPDDVICGIVADRLSQTDCADGYILDGVPRTVAQAEFLEKEGIGFDVVLSIEITDREVEARMTGRRTCARCGDIFHVTARPPAQEGVCDKCGGELAQRADDALETVKRRLEAYHQETEPLKEFYAARGLLKSVNNRPTIDETTQAVIEALDRG